MKSEVELWISCLIEAGHQHHVQTTLDLAYARSRIEHEGMAFLTITLPKFEKDFLTAVSRGFVGSDLFHGFRRRGGLPAFLSGFLRQMFDGSGALREDASASVMRSIRQVLLLLSKVEYPVSASRRKKAIRSYVSTDEQLVELNERLKNAFRSAARTLLGPYLQEVERALYWREYLPRHSTGALATKESPNGRWASTTWTERLQSVLRWEDDLHTCPSESYYGPEVTVLAEDSEPAAKLVTVPKTMKGPRVIVEEPVYNQYVQQGILNIMSDVLTQRRFRHLAERFSWADQTPNRELAREGSYNGAFATIDLSEASDRVTLELVEVLLDSVPFLRDAVTASRSRRVQIGPEEAVTLNKFSSMGSALCFPIESMVFYILVSLGQAAHHDIAPSMLRASLKYGEVRVYGDDIIVPADVAHSAIHWLESYGLKVNVDKTFTTGPFRESCGADWFRGKDVSVFKLRQPLPEKRHHVEALRSAIQFHNRAFGAGWFLVAEWTAKYLDKVHRYIPRAPFGLAAHALWTYDEPTRRRHNHSLHQEEFQVLKFREVKPVDPVDGYGALKKSLTRITTVCNVSGETEGDHLQRGGRSQCVGVNIGYTGWQSSP